MKVASIIAFAATAIASVHATGPVGSTCQYGTTAPPTPEPTTPEPTTPEPTTTAPPPAPVDCKLYTKETDPGQYGECKDDGTNKWYKSKILGIQIPAENGGAECVGETDPSRTVTELCPAENCKPLSVEADQGEYGPCTKDDVTGKYFKSKVLGVLEDAKFGGTCDPKDRTHTEPCEAVDCVPLKPEEDNGPFGECKDDGTNKWYKSKILGIKTPASNGGAECESEDKRVYSVLCDAVNCKAVDEKDDTGAFGACEKDDVTGKYIKSKVLAVKDEAINGGTCDPKDRTVKEECAAIDCKAYTKETDLGSFGECKDDGSNKWYKYKVLGIETPAQYGGVECESEEKRTISELCDPVNCKAVDEKDDTGAFGECEKDDVTGKYFKSKVLAVKDVAINGGTCDPKDRTVKEECVAVDCKAYTKETDLGSFGECKDDGSNKWYKYKVLGIETPAQYGGAECESEEKRTISELCPAENCKPLSPEADQGPYGECKKDDVTGKYVKSKVLGVAEEAKFGGTCEEKDRIFTEPCTAIDCVPYTKETDPGQFGECKDDGTNKWYKSKVLGIQTPAQYGGAECESEEKRTISEFCEPVNCVPVAEKDDTGAFGECKLDVVLQKYYKSKVLAIKEPAQNGGTCLESERTVKELCPAVNCVPYTEAEDQGKFGSCQKFPDGKYYRTKVLGIKTPAQYGGSCPSEAARTVKQLCPDDGYCVPSDPFYDVCVPKLAQCGAKKENTIYFGYDISVTKGLALWQCCDKCATTAGCVAYSFERNSDAKKTECNLKWKIGEELYKRNAVSSAAKAPLPKKCTYRENYMFSTGLTKSLAKFDTEDMDECCNACAKRSDCKGFNLQHHTCYLEAKVGDTYFWLGGNSGIKV